VSREAKLAAVAASQYGVFTLAQARAAGFTDAAIRQRRRTGVWREVHRGVLALAGAPRSSRSDLSAALLARPGSLVSHESSGRLLAMRYVLPPPRPIVSTPHRSHPLEGVDVRRRRRLDVLGTASVDGLAVTDRATTLIDLAETTRSKRFERIIDDQLSAHLVEIEDLIDRFDLMARRGAPGIALARSVLMARCGDVVASESDLEQRFRESVAPHLSVRPTYQFLPPWRTEGVGRVDVAFPAQLLIAELDGRRWHLRDVQWEHDHERDQIAMAHGWHTIRYTYRQVRDSPRRVASNLDTILQLGAGSVAG
jgi:hypothetical protein